MEKTRLLFVTNHLFVGGVDKVLVMRRLDNLFDVAPREGSVDRNNSLSGSPTGGCGRSPRGERG